MALFRQHERLDEPAVPTVDHVQRYHPVSIHAFNAKVSWDRHPAHCCYAAALMIRCCQSAFKRPVASACSYYSMLFTNDH